MCQADTADHRSKAHMIQEARCKLEKKNGNTGQLRCRRENRRNREINSVKTDTGSGLFIDRGIQRAFVNLVKLAIRKKVDHTDYYSCKTQFKILRDCPFQNDETHEWGACVIVAFVICRPEEEHRTRLSKGASCWLCV